MSLLLARQQAETTHPVGKILQLHPDGYGSKRYGSFASKPLGGQTISPTSIDSAEAFGTAALHLHLHLTGIDGAEAFGTLTTIHHIEPSSITTAEAFGSGTVVPSNTVEPTAIGSGEAFGTSSLNHHIDLTGLSSAEAFGNATVLDGSQVIAPTSINSDEVFGSLTLIAPRGVGRITQLAPHGSPMERYSTFGAKHQFLIVTGIPTDEAFGTVNILEQAAGGGSIVDHSYRRGRGRR